MKKLIGALSAIFLSLIISGANADAKNYNMVCVPASEKGDENDYTSLVKIVNKLTGFKIKFIKIYFMSRFFIIKDCFLKNIRLTKVINVIFCTKKRFN